MANFYRINIGTISLTKTGAAGGLPCKLEIENVEDLQVAVTGNSQITATGARIRQTIDWTGGKEFTIKISTLTAAIYSQIKTLLNTANETGATFTVAGAGDSGDFSVTARPHLQKPFSCKDFRNGRINDIVLRFET